MIMDAFDVRSAVASMCRRHPALDTQLRPFLEQEVRTVPICSTVAHCSVFHNV